jgi:probable phosphoglycerate mutase
MEAEKKGKIILFIMRHGQTVLNKAEITQGWCDGNLTEEGAEAALSAGIGLSDVIFKAVYSSDLGRAVKTAEIVIKENKEGSCLKLKKLEGLRELNFGKYEGQMERILVKDMLDYMNVSSFKEAMEKYDFQKEFCNTCAALDETKKAEDYDTVIKRVMDTLEKICLENLDDCEENVFIVAHGGIIRLIIDYLDKSFNIDSIDNLSISKIMYENGSFKVESVNDNSYYKKGQALKEGTL